VVARGTFSFYWKSLWGQNWAWIFFGVLALVQLQIGPDVLKFRLLIVFLEKMIKLIGSDTSNLLKIEFRSRSNEHLLGFSLNFGNRELSFLFLIIPLWNIWRIATRKHELNYDLHVVQYPPSLISNMWWKMCFPQSNWI